ncbi:hypothetical protein MKX07_005966 [Trichoderma sp. CBMAI-0711]|nr:hypothetical protein MKX07_005966 [Trichoderma sp. CBMAI-0711]
MAMSPPARAMSTAFDSGTGRITPHSQFRQFILMALVDLSLDSRPLTNTQRPSRPAAGTVSL